MKRTAIVLTILALIASSSSALAPMAAPAHQSLDVDWICRDGKPVGMLVRADRAGEWTVRLLSPPCVPARQS